MHRFRRLVEMYDLLNLLFPDEVWKRTVEWDSNKGWTQRCILDSARASYRIRIMRGWLGLFSSLDDIRTHYVFPKLHGGLESSQKYETLENYLLFANALYRKLRELERETKK